METRSQCRVTTLGDSVRKMCRICLDDDNNKQYFEDIFREEYLKLINVKLLEMNNYPLFFCSICVHLLKKYVCFREMCLKASEMFKKYVIDNEQFRQKDVIRNTKLPLFKSYIGPTKMLTFEIIGVNNDKKRSEENTVYSHSSVEIDGNRMSSIGSTQNEKNNEVNMLTEELDIKSHSIPLLTDEIVEIPVQEDLGLKVKEELVDVYDVQDEDYFPGFDLEYPESDDSNTPLQEYRNPKKKKKRYKRKSNIKKQDSSSRKNGISSRMVLETEQYKVIKLTDAQVLEEMRIRETSMKYLNAPYRCQLCVKGFNYEDVLQNHMTRHEPVANSLECHLCHQHVPSVISLRGHIKSHTTKYECKQCGEVKASRQHLIEHCSHAHNGVARVYVCKQCGKTTDRRTMFQKHVKMHAPSGNIACNECGKLFKSIETLRAHMLRHADVKRYRCDKCPKEFRYASLLYTHKFTHVTQRKFYCVECDLYFKTSTNLKLHLRKSQKHVNPSLLKYACKLCDKRYDDSRSLKQHVDWFHLKVRNHKCSRCEMAFGSADGLRSHTRKKHDGVTQKRNHQCELCSKAFKTKAVLVKHIRVHTGERPYECQDCGKKFAQYSTMTTHVKLVHLKIQRNASRKTTSNRVHIDKRDSTVFVNNIPDHQQPPSQYTNWNPHAVENLTGPEISGADGQISSYS